MAAELGRIPRPIEPGWFRQLLLNTSFRLYVVALAGVLLIALLIVDERTTDAKIERLQLEKLCLQADLTTYRAAMKAAPDIETARALIAAVHELPEC